MKFITRFDVIISFDRLLFGNRFLLINTLVEAQGRQQRLDLLGHKCYKELRDSPIYKRLIELRITDRRNDLQKKEKISTAILQSNLFKSFVAIVVEVEYEKRQSIEFNDRILRKRWLNLKVE